MSTNILRCFTCQAELVSQRTSFSYMGHTFYENVPRCPVCGQVYISPELASGRMARVEMELEDK